MVRAAPDHATCYAAWAELLRYPGRGEDPALSEHVGLILEQAPERGVDLLPLLEYLEDNGPSALEEVFTRTFDANAERALEVGWHLYGENYARGAFMVRMRDLLRRLDVTENAELPDHISHVLLVLARADTGTARAIASGVLSPALAKILEGFGDQGNPYHGVMRGLKRFVDDAHSTPSEEAAPAGGAPSELER